MCVPFNSAVQARELSIFDLRPKVDQKFLVLCAGVALSGTLA
jgi:hypothetical protein